MKLFNDKYGLIFVIFGILLQIFAFIYTGASWLSLISGVTGILAVVLCAERRISFYIFGWIQLITYVILAIQQNLWGEVGENIFYALTMLYGMYYWFTHKDSVNNDKVISKKLSNNQLISIGSYTVIGLIVLYIILNLTNDTQPLMDSISTVPAIVAQILMILAYREQWYFWLVIDVASIIMWAIAGDWCMVSQFIFWTINCLYGLKNWR